MELIGEQLWAVIVTGYYPVPLCLCIDIGSCQVQVQRFPRQSQHFFVRQFAFPC